MNNMNKCLFVCFVLLIPTLSAKAGAAPQDTAKVVPPPTRYDLYFLSPLYNFTMVRPVKLHLPMDPLFASPEADDLLYQRQMFSVYSMGQQVTADGIRQDMQGGRIYYLLGGAFAGFAWGMIIKENIEGYINAQNQSPPPPPPNTPARPPELQRP
jgi:hypothetical protein